MEYWQNWCRLCGKTDGQYFNALSGVCAPNTGSIEVYTSMNFKSIIAEFFLVHIKEDEKLSSWICRECCLMVQSFAEIKEKIKKVQSLYNDLLDSDDKTKFDLKTLYEKYDLFKEEYTAVEEYTKPPIEEIFIAVSNVKNESASNTFSAETPIKEVDMASGSKDPFGGAKTFNAKEKCFQVEENDTCSGQAFNDMEVDTSEEEEDDDNEKPFNKINNEDISYGHAADITKISKYICNICAQRFKRSCIYAAHMIKKHDKIICPDCPGSFENETSLKRHMKEHLQLFPCPHCDRKFQRKKYIEQHIKFVHNDERPVICEACGDAVRTKAQLKEHMLTHTDYSPYECKECGKCFKLKQRLKNHMEIHNPNKHICAECGLQLNSRDTLNRHLLVHSDVMQHKCDFCGRAFKRAKALKNHLILHTGLKPYSCDFCDRTFANGSNCRTHKRKAHPEELAALEASGGKTYTKNIPKLTVLKSVTRAAENLAPVVSKQSGNFAFGKKPKLSSDNIGTVSKKQAKMYKESLSSLPIVNEPNGASNNIVCQPLLSHSQKHSQCTNSANNTESRSIPTIDNIYNHLVKQTATNNHYNISTGNGISPLPPDIKPTYREELSPNIAQQQNQFSAQLLSPSQHSVIPNDVPSFCTQYIKQIENVQQHPQPSALHQVRDKEASTDSPESHVSHLTEDHSTSTADANHFYNQIRRHTPNFYL